MIETDLEDTHLCIKCSATIVGLANYIEHRKRNCGESCADKLPPRIAGTPPPPPATTTDLIASAGTYATFGFPVPPSSGHTFGNKSELSSAGKGAKTPLHDGGDVLPYELGADIFFSSLQLQSVQATGSQSTGSTTTTTTPGVGKPTTGVHHHHQHNAGQLRAKPEGGDEPSEANVVGAVAPWIATHDEGVVAAATAGAGNEHHEAESLMEVVDDMHHDAKKPYEVIFGPINPYEADSPDGSEEDDDDDEEGDGDADGDVDAEEEVDVEMEMDEEEDEDDDDHDPIAVEHATGGKWKLSLARQSPPVVPATHTGGKWKPGNYPNSRVGAHHGHHGHTSVHFASDWLDEPADELDIMPEAMVSASSEQQQHPPAGHTKGKWIPGTKHQRLEYKEEVELAKSASNQNYWCNICCRELKSKSIYENHLKTNYHRKRAEPEQQLEKAALDFLFQLKIEKEEPPPVADAPSPALANVKRKRKRRAAFIRCDLCKHVMFRHLIGKHLISHYHYRRLQSHPGASLRMILDNIHSIVLQSPFQCRPCQFYTNTEDNFLDHWNSPEHRDASEGPGKFWCSFCHFECEDNNQMRRHLLGGDHKEVILAINRSVPICISKKLDIDCALCGQSFRYNVELRRHIAMCHPAHKYAGGTASDFYQNRLKCHLCGEYFHSTIALQRHRKNKHALFKYFCSICQLDFDSPAGARQHRKTFAHRQKSAQRREGRGRLYEGGGGKRPPTGGAASSQAAGELGCQKCSHIATSEVEALLHVITHREQSPVEQKTNDLIAENPETPEKISSPALPNSLKCKDCEAIFGSKKTLRLHRNSAHPLLSHTCLSCGQSFALPQALGRHTRKCRAGSGVQQDAASLEHPWQCELCDLRTPFESDLIYHRLHHTYGPVGKNQRLPCPICRKEFRGHSLRCHLRQHTNEKIFECEQCEVKFSRRHNLKDHIKKMHKTTAGAAESVVVPAPVKRSALNVQRNGRQPASGAVKDDPQQQQPDQEHQQRQHSPAREQAVAAAATATSSSAARRRQRRVRHHPCDQAGCHYVAPSKHILKVHMASHSQQQFPCQQAACNYVGRSVLHLRRHAALHFAPAKWHKCMRCDFKSRFAAHIRRHTIAKHAHENEDDDEEEEEAEDAQNASQGCVDAADGGDEAAFSVAGNDDDDGGGDGDADVDADAAGRRQRAQRPCSGRPARKIHQCPHCQFRCSSLDNLRKHVLKTNKHPGKFMYECELCRQSTCDDQAADVGALPADAMSLTASTTATPIAAGKERRQRRRQVFRTNSLREYQFHVAQHHA